MLDNPNVCVRILNLRKTYQTGGMFKKIEKEAVQGLYLTLQKGELLALLGQNGAGKTSTMHMLSGFSPVTSGITIFLMNIGDAYLFGQLLSEGNISSFMGICPQHDILFDDLTAKEHIILYAGLKGVNPNQFESIIQHRLSSVRLLKVADKKTKTYSGG